MPKRDTKSLLFEKGVDPIYFKGYNATGIQEILKAAGVPKGSFYFHFKSKEDYVLQLMDRFGIFMLDWMDRIFADQTMPPLHRLRRYYGEFLDYFEANRFRGGCPIGNLAQEMGDLNDALAQKAELLLVCMRQRIQSMLEEAVKTGAVPPACRCEVTADFILNSWQGALTRSKLTRNRAPLENFERIIFEQLLR